MTRRLGTSTAKMPPEAQTARMRRLFRLTGQQRAKNRKTVRIRITDLEMLIAIAAVADANFQHAILEASRPQ